jgi:hypothetical protein
MYAFIPGKCLCLVYEDFYLAISNTFYETVNIEGRLPDGKPRTITRIALALKKDESCFHPIYVGTV